MTGAPHATSAHATVSVVVPTRNRPRELRMLLLALRAQSLADFEVVVVGDRASLRDCGVRGPGAVGVIYRQCAEANIARARNIGVAAASGEVIAFIDDDATPEPGWLDALAAPFADSDVGGVGGYARGWNGVSFQFRASALSETGETLPLDDIDAPRRMRPLSFLGANCAYRRAALDEIGGFDENYRYFLDESDVNLRLHRTGWTLRFAPAAEVQHLHARSSIRRANRAPLCLFEIGASKAYFLMRHARPDQVDLALARFRDKQRARLLRMVHDGRLEPVAVPGLLETLEDGLAVGFTRSPRARVRIGDHAGPRGFCADPRALADAPRPSGPPAPRRTRPAEGLAIIALPGDLGRMRAVARALAADGRPVTLIDFRWSPRPLRAAFHEDGYWWHKAGVFGLSERDAPRPAGGRAARALTEFARIRASRRIACLLRPDHPAYAPAPQGAVTPQGAVMPQGGGVAAARVTAAPWRIGIGQTRRDADAPQSQGLRVLGNYVVEPLDGAVHYAALSIAMALQEDQFAPGSALAPAVMSAVR